jgi:hypothetical protein
VNSTLKISGNLATMIFSTSSPSSVGKKRRCSTRTYSRAESVEMIAL